MANTPSHWCRIPELENLNASTRKSLAIPRIAVRIILLLILVMNILL
jgi:hypothetical protein